MGGPGHYIKCPRPKCHRLGFWCVIVLVWVATYLAYQEGREQGIWLTANLSIDELKNIQELIRKIESEENTK
jgi:hypothetical protein